LNECRPILSAAYCRSMIIVSRNIRYMRIFAGRDRQIQYMLPFARVPQGGGVKQHFGCRRHFLAISVATSWDKFADKDQQESRAVAGKPHDAVVKFDTSYRNLQRCSPSDSTAFLLYINLRKFTLGPHISTEMA